MKTLVENRLMCYGSDDNKAFTTNLYFPPVFDMCSVKTEGVYTMASEADVKTDLDTVERLKAEAMAARSRASWRENEQRLIWCGARPDGTFTFRNTVSATSSGPKISEIEAARLLASEGPWLRPLRS